VRPLVRADPNHHCHQHSPRRHQQTGQTAAGMPYTGPALRARPSFEPRHGKVRQGRHIDLKPGTRAGRRFGSQPHRTSPDATATAAPSRTVSIRRLGVRYSQSLLSRRRSTGLPAKEPFQEPTWTDFRPQPATSGDC
jgi:hypothetical protein